MAKLTTVYGSAEPGYHVFNGGYLHAGDLNARQLRALKAGTLKLHQPSPERLARLPKNKVTETPRRLQYDDVWRNTYYRDADGYLRRRPETLPAERRRAVGGPSREMQRRLRQMGQAGA